MKDNQMYQENLIAKRLELKLLVSNAPGWKPPLAGQGYPPGVSGTQTPSGLACTEDDSKRKVMIKTTNQASIA